jgi:predicted Zn-dependent protease with MMP-like domain
MPALPAPITRTRGRGAGVTHPAYRPPRAGLEAVLRGDPRLSDVRLPWSRRQRSLSPSSGSAWPTEEAYLAAVQAAAQRHFSERVAHEGPLVATPDEPPLVSDEVFAQLVRAAIDELPEQFRRTLDTVPVMIADRGGAVGAYGLYHGSGIAHPGVPAQIIVFRDTLLRDFGHDPHQLAEQVRRVVRHELGHHLGFDEDGVRRLGL